MILWFSDKQTGKDSSGMRKAYLQYFAALLLFGSNGLLVSAINLPSSEIVFLRTLLGSGVLFAAVAVLKPAKLGRRDALFVVGSGIAMGASWTVQYEAYRFIGVGISSLVYCLGPVLIVALAPRALGEQPSSAHKLGLVVVLVGVLLINGQALSSGASLLGVVCALATVAAYVVMVMLIKRAKDTCGVRGPAVQMLAACAFAFAASVVIQGSGVEQMAVPAASDVIPLLMFGLVNGGICCYWYFNSISKLPAQSVAVCDYLEPLSALVLSSLVLGETLGGLQVLGAVLVFAGAVGSEVLAHVRPGMGLLLRVKNRE